MIKMTIPLVGLSLFLAGCGQYREYTPPDPPTGLNETDFSTIDAGRFKASQPVAGWWEKLGDNTLNKLVQDGITNNPDVQIALTNVLEARALSRETKLDRFPTIQAFFDYRRQKLTEEGITFSLADPTFNTYETGFDLSWEIDLFGRVSNRIDALKAQDQARLADYRGALVAVTAEIASAYIDLRGAQYRLKIARQNAANQEKTYNLTQTLLQGGSATSLDVARAKTQLDLTQASIPPLESETKAAIFRLSVLTGKVPNALEDMLSEKQPLPTLPESVGVGTPEELLRRRPDIRAAERGLAASVSEYNIAVADLFPSVTILGSIGFSATSLSNYQVDEAVTYSVGPSIRWAAFDLGRVYARIDQEDAASFRALKNYENTVLEALEEVQNALTVFTNEEKRMRKLRDAAQSSAQAANLARRRFEAGIDNFIDVLDAERTQLEAQDALAVSETQTARNIVEIYRALGGGWDHIAAPDALPNANSGQWKGLNVSSPLAQKD